MSIGGRRVEDTLLSMYNILLMESEFKITVEEGRIEHINNVMGSPTSRDISTVVEISCSVARTWSAD